MTFRWIACAFLAGLISTAAHAQPIKRARYPALSPDGKTIAFSYQGDLWDVPATGGRATRLTTHPARDVQPLYSPDGKNLVFASNRYGNYDLFVMPSDGGPARRLTFSSANEFPASFTPDGQWLLFYGSEYGSSDLFKIRLSGGEPIRLTWDWQERKYFGSVSPDGQWVAFNDNSAPGNWRRRGYEGSNNSDVWLARLTTPLSDLKRLTTNPGNDFMPLFSHDGHRLYYTSDRKGQVNLWSMDLNGGGEKQLTFHTSDGVRIPSLAAHAERIAYEFNSEIWLLDLKSGKTAPVTIDVVTDERRNPVVERTVTANPSEFSVAPDGKKIALIVRGDLFVIPATGGPARRLVGRSSRQSHLSWLSDSHTILFTTDEAGQKDLHSIEITGQNEKTLAAGPEDETNARVSPDGKLIAYHRGDHAIVVIPVGGGDPVATIKGDFVDVTRGYSPDFDWSPDSKWLAFQQSVEGFEEAIYVASVADGRSHRIAHPFRQTNTPHWASNGRMIYFTGVAVDSSNLYAVDWSDEEKPQFEEDALDRLDQSSSGDGHPVGTPAVNIDFATVEQKLRRVTARGGVGDAVLTPSSRTFLFEAAGGLQTVSAEAKDATGSSFADEATDPELTRDGGRVYFMSGGQIQSMGLLSRDRRPAAFTATVSMNSVQENRQIFDEAWWLLDRYFYDERHNGVDWASVRAKYQALLPYVPYKDDFYDLMSEMVQELHGSHLGITGPTDYVADTPSITGFLGVEPDWATLESEGKFKVAGVLPHSPADSKWSKLNPGDYILAIDGQALDNEHTFDALLDRKAGKKVVLTVNDKPSTDGARAVAIRPVPLSAADDLRYEAWVQHERDLVHQLSGGRLAYLHVREMNVPSELRFKEEFVSEASGRNGLLVDVRYNGGGNVAHRLLDILRKKPYVSFRPRSLGQQVMVDWPNEYLWGKPAALLVNQDSASNSEMMAEGFRSLGIGPIVGVPTMGAVIATGSWSFLDGGTIRMPSAGVYTAAGENLELHGRQPDVNVPYDPMAAKEGRDPQLEAAVKVLLAKLPLPGAGGPATADRK